jgi:hypothetical protein
MNLVFLGLTIKDWLIIVTSFILVMCVLEIHKLKRSIAQQTRNRLIPQLILELISEENNNDKGFYLRNESFFLAKDIEVEDVELTLDDFGFKKNLTLKFENIDFLKPKETNKLKLKVFDRGHFEREVTEKIIPHLLNASFKVKVIYTNIENLNFRVVFSRKRGKFYTEEIEFSQ